MYLIRKPGSDGPPQGGGSWSLSPHTTQFWVWRCILRDTAAKSYPHSGHQTCCLNRYQYSDPSPVICNMFASTNLPTGEWHSKKTFLVVSRTFLLRPTWSKRSVRTSKDRCYFKSLNKNFKFTKSSKIQLKSATSATNFKVLGAP